MTTKWKKSYFLYPNFEKDLNFCILVESLPYKGEVRNSKFEKLIGLVLSLWAGMWMWMYIGKIVKKHPPLCKAQRVQKSVNPETKKITRLQNCSRGPDHFSESNFKFQMFSNDILNGRIVTKAVTIKTVIISNFCSMLSLGHGLSGTVLTLLWNPVVATQSGWACTRVAQSLLWPPAAIRDQLNIPPTRFRQIRLSATTYGPLV